MLPVGLTAVWLSPSPLHNGGEQNTVPRQEGCNMKLIFEGTHPGRCPECGSGSIHRSRRKGLVESILHHALFISPYRCDECYERHFRFRSTKEAQHTSTQRPRHAA